MTPRVAGLLEVLSQAGDDPERLDGALDDLDRVLPELSADEARLLYEAVSIAERSVRTRRDQVRSKLGGAGKSGRAMRGFGRAIRATTFMRGQRIDRDV